MTTALRRLWIAAKVASAAASVAATVYLTLAGLKIGTEPHPVPVVASVGVLAAISLFTSVRATLYEARREKATTRTTAIRQQLVAVVFDVARVTDIYPEELTASLFLLRGFGNRRRLHRSRDHWVWFRPRTESLVRWTKGKGVIGECWATNRVTARDIRALNESRGACTEEEWRAAASESRMGLSFDDWQQTRGKYDCIIAAPLHIDGKVVGCIALDGPATDTSWVFEREVREALEAAAELVSITISL